MPVIQFFHNRTIFKNPGDALATQEELLKPGVKEVRNPTIVNAFRRIGLSDQAGTGIRSIFKSWTDLGHVPPIINNSKSEKYFEIILKKQELLPVSNDSHKADAIGNNLSKVPSLITQLSENQKAVIAFCTVHRSMSEIQKEFKFKNRSYFKNKVMKSLLTSGLLQMSNPEKPSASNQKYVITKETLKWIQNKNE